jgi:hypothetical protein
LIEELKLTGQNTPVFVGHMVGGLLAKTMAMNFGAYAVAFESPKYKDTVLSWDAKETEGSDARIINVESDDSIFAMTEDVVASNMKIPTTQSFFKPANPYETFCLIAAACTTDDYYDTICDATIGMKKFKEYFNVWGRPRT